MSSTYTERRGRIQHSRRRDNARLTINGKTRRHRRRRHQPVLDSAVGVSNGSLNPHDERPDRQML